EAWRGAPGTGTVDMAELLRKMAGEPTPPPPVPEPPPPPRPRASRIRSRVGSSDKSEGDYRLLLLAHS
ncbi:MAG: hypothetical protein QW680_14395, partial [Pyrobaculum sp.]